MSLIKLASHTYEEIGKRYGISRQRVHQIGARNNLYRRKWQVQWNKDKKVANKLFKWLVKYKYANDGNSPSVIEMLSYLGDSNASKVYKLLYILEDQGKIKFISGDRQNKIGRGIIIIGGKWEYTKQ